MTIASAPAMDEAKLNAFIGKALGDMGAAMSASLTVIGDKLGLYKALHEHGPATSAELAGRTKTHERYVREWLAAQAAGGYVEYDPQTRRFTLPPEQAFMLADESSPLYVQGAFQLIEAAMADEPQITEAFKSGRGFGWHEHDARLFEGTERFFRPGYNAHLAGEWIPALDGVEAKLREGANVADVGCGLGASTIVMATAYPKSTFTGFDYHRESIERAKERAAAAGRERSRQFRSRERARFPGRRLRPHRVLRLSPRHGRPGRRVDAYFASAQSGWHVAVGGAVCKRPTRGESEPDRPHILRGIDIALYAGIAFARRRARPWRTSRRAAHPRGRYRGRFHPLPPSDPNAV